MAYQDLNEFIALLEDKGQRVRVTEPINPHLEITNEIAPSAHFVPLWS